MSERADESLRIYHLSSYLRRVIDGYDNLEQVIKRDIPKQLEILQNEPGKADRNFGIYVTLCYVQGKSHSYKKLGEQISLDLVTVVQNMVEIKKALDKG